MTCTICNNFQKKNTPPDVRPRVKHHKVPESSWDALLHSAESCYCCRILVSGCRGCFHQHNLKETDVVRVTLRFYYPDSRDIDLDLEDAKELHFLFRNGQYFYIECVASPNPSCPVPSSWDEFPTRARTSPRTDSDMALVSIKGWIAGCIVGHTPPDYMCNAPESPCLPTRIVDVGLIDGVVRLVEPNGARDKYICLSHCWGHVQIITTTKATLETHKTAIAWDSLSRTFQDAILLTRNLYIKYIWIDSLCIIQDDAEDWEIESSRMASVYSNSHLTIAATHSANGGGGLFRATPDFRVSGQTPSGEDYCLYFREFIDHHLDAITMDDDNVGYPTEIHFPLLTRAWVYQERMLSTRVIHFGRHELFYECRSWIECECGDISSNGSNPATSRVIIKLEHASALYEHADTLKHALAQIERAKLWRTLVGAYTALQVTKSSDRLPAIGGMARDLATRRKTKYYAGLWEETMNDDLLWIACGAKNPRPYPWNGPTWSWASVEGPVHYWDEIAFTDMHDGSTDIMDERPPYQHLSTIEDCEVTPSLSGEFGPILEGSVTISGLLVEGVLDFRIDQNGIPNSRAYDVSFPDSRLPINTDYRLDHPGPSVTNPGTAVFCLRMSCIEEGHADHLISLVLKKSTTFHGCFERIGSLQIRAKPPPVDPLYGPFRTADVHTVTIV